MFTSKYSKVIPFAELPAHSELQELQQKLKGSLKNLDGYSILNT